MRLFLLLLLVPLFAIKAQLVEPFDGEITEWFDYWCSGDGYVNLSYDSTLAGREGAAALKCEWKLDIVDYGGGCSFAHKVDSAQNIDMSNYDTLTIWYYVEKPMTFEFKDSIAFSLILLDNHDQADYDANGTVEMWGFDAYGVYDNTVGWHAIYVPLEESDSRETGLMIQGDPLNGTFDPDAIKGFYLEWGNWERWFADTTGTIADSGVVYFDNMVLGTVPVTAISDNEPNLLKVFKLKQNYPNPFNPSTTIDYTLSKSGRVTLEVYNLLGQRVRTLVNAKQTAGHHQVKFDGSDLTSGVYLYKLTTGSSVETKKMILMK